MDIKSLRRLVRRGWLFLLASGLVGLGCAATYQVASEPTYTAQSALYLSAGSGSSVADLSQGSTYTQQVVKSFSAIAVTPIVLNSVRSSLGLTTSARYLAQSISVTTPLDTSILEISATSKSARQSANLANAVASRLISIVPELSLGTSARSIKMTLIQQATPNDTPDGPGTLLVLGFGVIAGIFAGLMCVFLRDILDQRLQSAAELGEISGRPVLGTIRFDEHAARTPLIPRAERLSAKAEAYRTIRAGLQFARVGSPRKSITITSAVQAEGKSVTALNLARSLSDAGQNVVLVDADLRRPSIAKYAGVEGSVGLSDVLVGDVDVAQALQPLVDNALMVLASGSVPPNPNELLQSSQMQALIEGLERKFDAVLFDCPPVLPVSDAAVLGTQTGGVVLVSAERRVTRAQVAEAYNRLERAGVNILGGVIVLHRSSRTMRSLGYSSADSSADV